MTRKKDGNGFVPPKDKRITHTRATAVDYCTCVNHHAASFSCWMEFRIHERQCVHARSYLQSSCVYHTTNYRKQPSELMLPHCPPFPHRRSPDPPNHPPALRGRDRPGQNPNRPPHDPGNSRPRPQLPGFPVQRRIGDREGQLGGGHRPARRGVPPVQGKGRGGVRRRCRPAEARAELPGGRARAVLGVQARGGGR